VHRRSPQVSGITPFWNAIAHAARCEPGTARGPVCPDAPDQPLLTQQIVKVGGHLVNTGLSKARAPKPEAMVAWPNK
jgi:hypothetical protein